jgi:Transposase
VKYVGVDWAYRQAQWCAVLPGGEIVGEGRISADRDALARLVLELGDEVKACLEMMSGALWVRDELVACGWQVEVADARKVKTVAPLAAKTDKVDARLLAELSRRALVLVLWLPSLDETVRKGSAVRVRQRDCKIPAHGIFRCAFYSFLQRCRIGSRSSRRRFAPDSAPRRGKQVGWGCRGRAVSRATAPNRPYRRPLGPASESSSLFPV